MYFPVYFLLLGNRLLDWFAQIPHGIYPFWFLGLLAFKTLRVLYLCYFLVYTTSDLFEVTGNEKNLSKFGH